MFVHSSISRRETPRRFGLTLLPLAGALAWHIAAICGLASWGTLDAPAASLRAAWNLPLAGSDLLPIGAALLVGGLTGAILAIFVKPLDDISYARLRMLRSLPFLILAPLLVMLAGPPHAVTLALIALNTAWPVYLLVFWGLLRPRAGRALVPLGFEKGQVESVSFDKEAKLLLSTLHR